MPIVLALGIIALICAVLAIPFMLMWNFAVVAAITVAKPIGYKVAFCLMMFISLFIAGSRSDISNK